MLLWTLESTDLMSQIIFHIFCVSLFSSTNGLTSFAVTCDGFLTTAPSLRSTDTPETSSTPSPTPSTPRCPVSSGGSTIRDRTSPAASSPVLASTPSVRLGLRTTSAEADRGGDDLQTSDEVSSDLLIRLMFVFRTNQSFFYNKTQIWVTRVFLYGKQSEAVLLDSKTKHFLGKCSAAVQHELTRRDVSCIIIWSLRPVWSVNIWF